MDDAQGTHPRTNCFSCRGRAQSEWCALDHGDVALLNDCKASNVYQPGQTIFTQGAACLGVFCVETGAVAIRKTDVDGNSVIVRLAHAGATLGYRAFFADAPYRASADALMPSRICFIDKVALRKLLGRNPTVGHSFLRHMARDLEEADEARLHAAALPVRARLAHLLLVLKDRFASSTHDGKLVIELPLSRQDMAAMVGTRPETIARAVRGFQDDRIARFDGRRVEVSDLERLLDELDSNEA